jgi:hypothetical protein
MLQFRTLVRHAWPRRVAVGCCVAVLLCFATNALAQEAKKEKFETTTADGVKLVGDFYPVAPDKAKNAPVVLLLHSIGTTRSGEPQSRRNFGKLAEVLQKEGYAVLAFDFRGYGDSTEVTGNYWVANPPAKPIIGKPKTQITSKDFRAREFLKFGNDLNAAKDWLNLRNNAGDCNSNNIVIVAAEQTSMIALVWVVGEFNDRNRVKPTGKAQGEDISCVISLSFSASLLNQSLDGWLKHTLKQLNKIPMANVIGEKDSASWTSWKRALAYIRPETDAKKFEELGTGTEVKAKTNLVGHKLLGQEALKTEEWLASYLKKIVPNKPPLEQPKLQAQGLFNIDPTVLGVVKP